MTTKPYQYPQETTESTGSGPDFPGSAGDREKGKFRPSSIPRRTTVAVSADDGLPVATATERLLADMLIWQKAVVLSLSLSSHGATFSVEDVLAEVSTW